MDARRGAVVLRSGCWLWRRQSQSCKALVQGVGSLPPTPEPVCAERAFGLGAPGPAAGECPAGGRAGAGGVYVARGGGGAPDEALLAIDGVGDKALQVIREKLA